MFDGLLMEFRAFSQEALEEIVRMASGALAPELPAQVSYLAHYLRDSEMNDVANW